MPVITLRHVTKRYDADRNLVRTTRDPITTAGVHRPGPGTVGATQPSQSTDEIPDQKIALNDLSLTLRDGETLSILGPSGCGKTTLLKVIAGLIQPDSGQVLFDGVPLEETRMADRGIGMVFQTYALYPHMRARENIGFYDLIRKQPEKIPERIQHIVEVMGVELHHLLSRMPPTLSGGEQQRVAMARCLARDPQLFLFDEPLSNLDAKLRVETRVQLKRLLQHYRITSAYVTHDQTEAVAIGDRIAIMRAGKIEQTGTFATLYNTPVNAFVAQFLGSPPMNLFSGHIWDDTWEGGSFEIKPIRPGLRKGQAVLLGIRPENVEIGTDGIPARVDFVEPILTQRRQLLFLVIGKDHLVASAPLGFEAAPNATVFVRFPHNHLYLFDQTSGTRIG
jgi:ABC-type sugar transport system ATPase subunit